MTVKTQSSAKATLQNYHALVERTYKGDVDAIVALVDLASAIKRTNLTARQLEVIALVYGADLTQTAAGKRLGVERSAVNEILALAHRQIDRVYSEWARKEATY